eukprot:4225072-Amphidinium_carterae.1
MAHHAHLHPTQQRVDLVCAPWTTVHAGPCNPWHCDFGKHAPETCVGCTYAFAALLTCAMFESLLLSQSLHAASLRACRALACSLAMAAAAAAVD